MTVVAVHPDSASLEFHMDVGGTEFRKFAELIDLESITVYGPRKRRRIERLHQKSRIGG